MTTILALLLRHVLTALGLKAFTSSDEFEQLLGALGIIGGLVWSIWQKKKAGEALVSKTDAKMLVFLLIASLSALTPGCASKVLPGNDPVIVRAQQTRAMAFDVIDSYLQLEYRNHEYLKLVSPDFGRLANRLIAGNKQWFKSFDAVLSAYKSSRAEVDKSKVISAAAVLETALLETQACLAQAAAEGVTP